MAVKMKTEREVLCHQARENEKQIRRTLRNRPRQGRQVQQAQDQVQS